MLTVILPTYNEARTIGPLIEAINQSLNGESYNILVVDDNSPDGTSDLAERLAQYYPINVLTRTDKHGLGSAIVDGLHCTRAAGLHYPHHIAVVMDSDFQHPPELIPHMLSRFTTSDLVIACRTSTPSWSLHRRLTAWCADILTKILIPSTRHMPNPLSGFFAIRSSHIPPDLHPHSWKVALDLLTTIPYSTIPYEFSPRPFGKSKLNLHQQLLFLRHLLHLSPYTPIFHKFIKFCIVGSIGVAINYCALAVLISGQHWPWYYANPIAITLAMTSNFILNYRWTFR